MTIADNGEWTYQSPDLRQRINKGDIPNYGDSYNKMALATFNINMAAPPIGNADILFYPGQLYRVDRETIAGEAHAPPDFNASTKLVTIDRLSSFTPQSSKGNYNITVEYPDVLATDLRTAGTDYASWLSPYMSLPAEGYRPPDVMNRVHNLALQLTAGMTNPYDMATAIQDYLRSGVFRYTLKPQVAPAGVDSLDFFLFTSHEGYCQYFATAMGDMLRSLGIPTRLVNGYGAGNFDTTKNRWEVRDEDAHTWVESYFPGYGWIPFEPTNDGTYFAIPRGTVTGPNLCLRDSNCDIPTGPTGGGGIPVVPNPGRTGGNQDSGGGAGFGPSGFRIHAPDATTLTRIVGVLLALLLILAAVVARYLRPRTVMGVWKRTLVLARLAGADVQTGETPLELSRRLARVFPEAAPSVRALAGGFVVAAYAPADLAQSTRASVMEAWSSLRPLMLRRVAGRFKPGRT